MTLQEFSSFAASESTSTSSDTEWDQLIRAIYYEDIDDEMI